MFVTNFPGIVFDGLWQNKKCASSSSEYKYEAAFRTFIWKFDNQKNGCQVKISVNKYLHNFLLLKNFNSSVTYKTGSEDK